MIPFRRRRDGSVLARFTRVEQELLLHLVAEFEGMLDSGPDDDPVFERLFPAAYPGDAEASDEFRHYTFDDLRTAKESNARVIAQSFQESADEDRRGVEVRLDAGTAVSWLKSLADLRLTLAVRLGIRNDGDEGPTGEDSRMAREAYVWLGYVQESLVIAVSR